MFSVALAEVSRFTGPVITSKRLLDGRVQAGCASYFAVNSDGWVLTAAHVFQDRLLQQAHAPQVAAYLNAVAAIEADPTLDAKHKRKRMDKVVKDDGWIRNQSFFFGADGPGIIAGHIDTFADIALLQLSSFGKLGIGTFARFRAVTNRLAQGTSLCRLGFPFHHVVATFDEALGQFRLGAGTLPVPRFPLDGILTREILIQDQTGSRTVECIETSSPGLRGQSGGPIFDVSGRVCAIQTKTMHLPLGFNPSLVAAGQTVVEHQFLNVGIGTHSSELMKFMDKCNVSYQTA